MNVLSLFDGMSCGQIALDRVGITVNNYFASEIDKYAIKVTQKNYPKTKQVGDVAKVKGAELPKIDLLISGSPCQGFSFAGRQLNFDDPRSKLFFEFVRLLQETQPKHFLLENVNMKKEYQSAISHILGVEPIEINSALVSAQNRRRLYWTNIPNVDQPEDKKIYLKDVLEGDKIQSVDIRSKSKTVRIGGRGSYDKHEWDSVGNKGTDLYYRKLTPMECERLQTVPDNYTDCVSDAQRYKMLGNGFTVDVIAHIFRSLLD